MKLAIQNSWPNLTFSAEREFIARTKLVGARLGWSVVEVVTSDDIISEAPDIVLVTHEFSPKLTSYPTIGLIWSPTAFFAADPDRVRNILSYDGYLVASETLRLYLSELLGKHGKNAPISPFNFLPTAQKHSNQESKSSQNAFRSLFYAGVHWDGKRHGDLFSAIRGRIPMQVHGDPKRWKHLGRDFAGPLPFDGTSVIDAIGNCGIALALHGEDHRVENIPSMRIFEATAAGAVVISDHIEFATKEFGDCFLYVDLNLNATEASNQIIDHVQWIIANPDRARDMANRGQEIFNKKFSLERLLSQLPDFLGEVKHSMGLLAQSRYSVDVIIRVGSRPLWMVQRAIDSVASQTHQKINLIVVMFRRVEGLTELLGTYKRRFTAIKVIDVPDNGVRSTALWAGLKATSSAFVGNVDDDDVIQPNHISSLVETLCESSARRAPLAYSGTVQIQEDDGHWFDQINFRGDIQEIIKERRQLKFLEVFDARRMLEFSNFIQSNAWLVRRSALTPNVLKDPELVVAEDVYFYLILMLQGPFVASWRPTAEWNWRSTTRDNVMFSPQLWGSVWGDLHNRLAEAGVVFDQKHEGTAPIKSRGTFIRTVLRSNWRVLSEPRKLMPRFRFGLALFRESGARKLLNHILRFGHRSSDRHYHD